MTEVAWCPDCRSAVRPVKGMCPFCLNRELVPVEKKKNERITRKGI